LTQSEGKRDGPSRSVPAFGSGCEKLLHSPTEYGSTSRSSGRGAFASLAEFRDPPAPLGLPGAVRIVRCTWFAVAGELPPRIIFA
jgi:hypothetical protein